MTEGKNKKLPLQNAGRLWYVGELPATNQAELLGRQDGMSDPPSRSAETIKPDYFPTRLEGMEP